MHGNVQEWCEDYSAFYPTGAITDPMGPATGENHVLRGGDFNLFDYTTRSSRRSGAKPTGRYGNVGLRLAKTK